jgi:hypothetical protein
MENVVEGSALQDQTAHNGFRVKVAGPDLNFRDLKINDAKPTGHQIVAAAGFHPVENYGVLQWLDTGDLEPLRLNESISVLIVPSASSSRKPTARFSSSLKVSVRNGSSLSSTASR